MTNKQLESQRRYRSKHGERVREAQRRYRAKNGARILASQRRYRAKNGDRVREWHRRWNKENRKLKTLYTRAARWRMLVDDLFSLLSAFKCCAICGGTAEHIDHNHSSGRIRGVLCNGCNTGIGQMGEDPARFRAAAEYLERTAEDD